MEIVRIYNFRKYLISVAAFFLVISAQGQSSHHQNIEINFIFSFSDKKLTVIYQIDPPDQKANFKYELHAHEIKDFLRVVLKPRSAHPFQFDGRKLSFDHNGNPYQKYEFKTVFELKKLSDQGILLSADAVKQFVLNSDVIKQFVPIAVSYQPRYSISICSDEFFESSLQKFVTFVDRNIGQTCLFATHVSIDELKKLTITFGRQDLIATGPLQSIANPVKALNNLSNKQQKAHASLNTDGSKDSTESLITSSDHRFVQENFCDRILSSALMEKCSTDSDIFFPGFFMPYDYKAFLYSKQSENQLFCLNIAFEKCSLQPFAADIVNAFYFVRDEIENPNDFKSFLVLKSAVESNINSGSRNWVRIYYIGLFYNIYYHFGKQILFDVFNEFLAHYPNSDIEDILFKRNLTSSLDFNRRPTSLVFKPVTYSIGIENSGFNKYKIAISDSSQVIRSGALMKWILYLSDGTVDTLYTTKDPKSFQEIKFQTTSEILYIYPEWEERIIWPTTERRPDFQALNELNFGFTSFNRYRAYRTMAATGNPNLLATAISLALDEKAEFIRNFAFERLGEVPEYQVLKIKDGLIKNISTTDGFWRPTVYQNAERLGLAIQRPAIGNQTGIDLYADLMVLKQFEGERAMDLALESFVEGNTDEGLIWFLAENGNSQVTDLLLTFDKSTEIQSAVKRICLVYQARIMAGKIKIQQATKEVNSMEDRLQSVGFTTEEASYIVTNVRINLRIFKAFFTTPYE